MRTLLWSYLGWRRFPRELGAFEVRHFLSLTRRDREALGKGFRTQARLGAAERGEDEDAEAKGWSRSWRKTQWPLH
jgi:hypothetical protein